MVHIDCDADPYIPKGWSVEEHKKGGTFTWDDTKVCLYVVEGRQTDKKWIEGGDLRKELTGKPVLNANVLDYLLAHPHLIPEDWKSKFVFFWGTIYRYRYGGLYVRYLGWDGDGWHWGAGWLDGD